MNWSPVSVWPVFLLMCVAITPAGGQAKQFTLKPPENQNAASNVISSTSMMSSIPSPSQKDEGIAYTLVEVEEIPVTPTPPLSKENLTSSSLISSIPAFIETTTGPTTSFEGTTEESLGPTEANGVLSSPLFYTPTVDNDSISLEPSSVVSTAPPTSDVVTPPLRVSPTLDISSSSTQEVFTSSVLTEGTCVRCSKPTSSSMLSDKRQPQSSPMSTAEATSGIPSSVVNPSEIAQTSSSGVVSCPLPPCSDSPTEMTDISQSPRTVSTPGNSNHFITTSQKDYDPSNKSAATTEAGLSPLTDDFLPDKQTSVSPGSDAFITTESNIDIAYDDDTTAHPDIKPSNSSHATHPEHPRMDFGVRFTASSILRCAKRPIDKVTDFVLHSLGQEFNLSGSHVFVNKPTCHCMTVNFLSLQRAEFKKVDAMARSHKIVFVMNLTVNDHLYWLQLIGSPPVQFNPKNLGGSSNECLPPITRKVPWRRLSKVEQIIVITVCTAGAMVVLAAFLFCMYEVQRRHKRKSFRLQSSSATMVRTEDFSLTKLDRPNTMYTDRGLIMEPIQPDDVSLPTMYTSSTSLEKHPGTHLANSPQKNWPMAPDPFPIRPSTSTENLVTAAARGRAGRKGDKIPGFDNPSFSSDDILASDMEENGNTEPLTYNKNIDSNDSRPERNGIKEIHARSNLLRPICDSSRSESIT